MTGIPSAGLGATIRRATRRAIGTDATAGGDQPAAVELDGVSVTLSGVRALEGVDLTARPGRFVGLIGPNGAGKTTALRTITAAVSPDAGAVRVGGSDVRSLPSREVSRLVAVVPQETAIAFDFTVRAVVAMGRAPYQDRIGGGDRSAITAVEAAMDRTDVGRFADRSIGEVSGGERQRVLLARAIAQSTPVLLLDEPTASLDINHQLRTFELVRSLVSDGKTVVAAIHDLNLAARYCDELALLEDGRLVAHGSPEQVLTPDRLRDVFGADTTVSRHPVTGAVHVTPLAPDASPASPRRGDRDEAGSPPE